MTVTRITVTFDSDGAGFVSRSCPTCHRRFKIKPSAKEQPENTFCPFCRHQGGRWETAEQIEYGKGIAKQKVVQPALDSITKSFRALGRSGGGIRLKFSGSGPHVPTPQRPRERIEELPEVLSLSCCGRAVRHAADVKPTFCPWCGESPSESTANAGQRP